MRLFCFPQAGAGGGVFFDWPKHLPPWIEVLGIELPGRATRLNEPPLASVAAMAERLAEAMGRLDPKPALFFGHSFGAIVAYELTQRLKLGAMPLPLAMIVSACAAPHLPSRFAANLYALPCKEFLFELSKRGGLPLEAETNCKLQELIEPALRADIRCRELWLASRTGVLPEPLQMPIYPMGGASDDFVAETDLAQWQRYTNEMHPVVLFPGGHFYLRQELRAVAERIAEIASAHRNEKSSCSSDDVDIRDIGADDLDAYIDYWHDPGNTALDALGVDCAKVYPADKMREMMAIGIDKNAKRVRSEASVLAIVFRGRTVGVHELTELRAGESAIMHAHIWSKGLRGHGIGAVSYVKAMQCYFDRFSLKHIRFETPKANQAALRIKEKLGLRKLGSGLLDLPILKAPVATDTYVVTREQMPALLEAIAALDGGRRLAG